MKNYKFIDIVMKKCICLILTCIMISSLVACGTAESGFADTRWVGLYTGEVISFNEDGSLEFGDLTGTWKEKENIITLKYTALNGSKMEMYLEILSDENDITFLKPQTSGKSDGEAVTFMIDETAFYPEAIVEEIKAEITNNIGDTVSTDIMNVVVKKAALGYYAEAASSNSTGETTNIDEACEPSDSGYYESSEGHCLLCIDFEIENTDSEDINTLYSSIISFIVNQNGESSIVRGYDTSDKDGRYGLVLWDMPISINNGDFITNETINLNIEPGQSAEIKYVGVVGFEPDDISDPFEVVVHILNSSGETESFIYSIN